MGQKIHPVLCRGEGYGMNIIKGRDLYDLEWYFKNQIQPNLKNMTACLERTGPWKGQVLRADKKWITTEINKSLATKDFRSILLDVQPLLSKAEFKRINALWSRDYFSKLMAANL